MQYYNERIFRWQSFLIRDMGNLLNENKLPTDALILQFLCLALLYLKMSNVVCLRMQNLQWQRAFDMNDMNQKGHLCTIKKEIHIKVKV